jgi:hypothetical protein
VSLLLKALSPKDSRISTQRDALQLRDEERCRRPADLVKEQADADALAEANAEADFDAWTRLDPAEYICGETAIIEPFEPFAQTATEFLADDALPDFDKLEAERLAAIEAEKAGAIESGGESIVEEVAAAEEVPVAVDIIPAALARLEELHRLIQRDREEAPPVFAVTETPPSPPVLPKLPLREEYRELRDHLLTRFPLNRPATLMVVDAGRTTLDASWLVPLAASVVQHFSEIANRIPKVLVVEAAGPDCSVARGMALQCVSGLSDFLQNRATLAAAFTPTDHPQIQLLSRGSGAIGSGDRERLAKLWPDLQQQFDLILIAAGAAETTSANSRHSISAAEIYLPLADGVILSVEIDGTPRNVAAIAHQRLTARGAKLIGCVVHGDAA